MKKVPQRGDKIVFNQSPFVGIENWRTKKYVFQYDIDGEQFCFISNRGLELWGFYDWVESFETPSDGEIS